MNLYVSNLHQARTTKDRVVAVLQTVLLYALYVAASKGLLATMNGYLPPSWSAGGWRSGYVGHLAILLVALALIGVLTPFIGSRFGLGWPKGPTLLGPALGFGALFGLLMLVVDYGPALWHHQAPRGPYGTALSNMLPWLAMQGIFVGISEEIPFRSLLLVFLSSRLPGRVRVGRLDVSVAGVVIGVAFSLAHADAFWTTSFSAALGQQIYAIGMSVYCAYLFEKSGSIVAPIVFHNAGDVVEWGLCFALNGAWR